MLTAEHAAARLGKVTATRVSQIVGLSPWGGPLACYLDMLGLLPQRENAPIRWGTKLQEVVRLAFEETTGLATEPCDGLLGDPVREWAGASLDALVTGPCHPLELKTARDAHGWGETGTDEVPESYALQVQWQLAVTGASKGYVAVLIAGQELRWYELPRHDGLIASLVDICRDFHARTVDRRPPDPDWQDPRTPELIGLLHRPREGVVAAMDGWDMDLADEYKSLGEVIVGSQKRRDEVKARLIERMGEASVGVLADGRRITRKLVNRAAYEVKAGEYFDFHILKPKRTKREPDGNP